MNPIYVFITYGWDSDLDQIAERKTHLDLEKILTIRNWRDRSEMAVRIDMQLRDTPVIVGEYCHSEEQRERFRQELDKLIKAWEAFRND